MTLVEKSVHLSLIVLAVVSSVVLIADRAGILLPRRTQGSGGMTRAKSVGRRVPPGVGLGTGLNVVLALRSDCRYCKASLPLYRQIVEVANQPGSHIAVQVVTEEDPARLREFLKSEGLGIAPIFHESLASLGVPGTPTILLADSGGTIKDELVGVLTKERAQALIRDLSDGKLPSARIRRDTTQN
jgi:thiol-disulfide isomerase/thioredoxin